MPKRDPPQEPEEEDPKPFELANSGTPPSSDDEIIMNRNGGGAIGGGTAPPVGGGTPPLQVVEVEFPLLEEEVLSPQVEVV